MNITDTSMIPAPSADALSAFPGNGAPWPLRSHLQLPTLPPAVPSARLHARRMLGEWQLNCLTEVELIVSELVTNAVRACSAVPVRLWLCSDRERVAIQVWDASDRMPVRHNLGPGAEGGRGLLIVDALSADWGAYRPATLCGKVVWAIVPGGVQP